MSDPLAMPLPVEALPQRIRRFADPSAPAAARTMAAKGLVPVQGVELVTLLAQLNSDPDPKLREAASASFEKMPENVLLPALEGELHPAVLDHVLHHFPSREDVAERVVLNQLSDPRTVEFAAKNASERLGEIIAENQQRLLGAPTIVEALYKNRNVRMSTADRLVELCARNGVELTGIPTFKDHAEAVQGQLIPEPSDEPLPSDIAFAEAAVEHGDEDAVEIDKVDASEEVKEKFKPLSFRVKKMTMPEKLRLAIVGDAAARSLLVRDSNRTVANAVLNSPSITEKEVISFAYSREISADILRQIGNKPKWLRTMEIKRALVFNPKTPVNISMRFLNHLRVQDLKGVSKSRGIPGPIKNAARQRLEKKMKK
ncbi:MAG: hypothetical protein AAF411_31445 [Myxococcota bacterium]